MRTRERSTAQVILEPLSQSNTGAKLRANIDLAKVQAGKLHFDAAALICK